MKIIQCDKRLISFCLSPSRDHFPDFELFDQQIDTTSYFQFNIFFLPLLKSDHILTRTHKIAIEICINAGTHYNVYLKSVPLKQNLISEFCPKHWTTTDLLLTCKFCFHNVGLKGICPLSLHKLWKNKTYRARVPSGKNKITLYQRTLTQAQATLNRTRYPVGLWHRFSPFMPHFKQAY